MRCLIILAVSILSFIPRNAFAQVPMPHIDTIHLIPDNPTPIDSVRVRVQVSIGKTAVKVGEDKFLSGDTLIITACFVMGVTDEVTTFDDTFNFGLLPVGQYDLKYTGYMSIHGIPCEPVDSNFYTTSFTVGFAGIEGKISANKTSLYPNPSSGLQTLDIRDLTPGQHLNIILYDLSGRKVKTVYSGIAVSDVFSSVMSLTDIKSGCYLLEVAAGDKREVIKLLKQ